MSQQSSRQLRQSLCLEGDLDCVSGHPLLRLSSGAARLSLVSSSLSWHLSYAFSSPFLLFVQASIFWVVQNVTGPVIPWSHAVVMPPWLCNEWALGSDVM